MAIKKEGKKRNKQGKKQNIAPLKLRREVF